MIGRYMKENAAERVRDYYNQSPSEAALGNRKAAFERAKAEYLSALRAQVETVEKITFSDVFPSKASKGA